MRLLIPADFTQNLQLTFQLPIEDSTTPNASHTNASYESSSPSERIINLEIYWFTTNGNDQ